MRALLSFRRKISVALLFVAAALLAACAHDKDVSLVNDPNKKYESTIPWNKQEKWETQGDPGMANLLQGR
jgi:outer membrane biogenesis lipoprotein LolB